MTVQEIEDAVIARARNRKRPLMHNDEMAIRVISANFMQDLQARGEWPPPASKGGYEMVVETLVACIGALEFEVNDDGSMKLRFIAPDAGMYPDEAA